MALILTKLIFFIPLQFFAQPVHRLICIFVKIYENTFFDINVAIILFSGN